MNLSSKPTPLPLEARINRCLAHGYREGEWCERRDHCATHQTIKHDAGINAPAAFRKCMTENMVGYLPMNGFPIEECEEEGEAA